LGRWRHNCATLCYSGDVIIYLVLCEVVAAFTRHSVVESVCPGGGLGAPVARDLADRSTEAVVWTGREVGVGGVTSTVTTTGMS